MIKQLYNYIRRLFNSKTYSLAIARRYTDANGSYVGELYLLGVFLDAPQYTMIGVSLDTLPFELRETLAPRLDLEHDFLAPMPVGYVRVGALDPRDNDAVRIAVRKLVQAGTIHLKIQNRFVEHVLSQPGKGDVR